MDRLNKTISDVAFILDNLILLRQIQQTGDCNICKNKDCGYIPKAGQMVRYNCPFYKAEGSEEPINTLDNLRTELEDYITHSPYIKSFMDCCRLRDDVCRIIDKYKE